MPFVGIGVGIGRQRFGGGIFAAYAARVAADGGVTEAGACVDAVSGISLNSSLLLVPSGYKSGVVYSEIPTNGDGDLTFTRASDATRVYSDGEIEVVGSGVPRLDYSQGSCPALLLEPQRTNLVTYSEQLDNADWSKVRTSISANATTSPDGTQNADLVYPSVSGLDFAFQQKTATGTTYSQSIYVKAGGKNYCWMLDITGNVGARFDLINGTVVNNPSGNAKIQSVGNGWFRISDIGVRTGPVYVGVGSADSASTDNATVNGTDGIYAWGAQVEEGSYATSYIPTLGTSVTRVADFCSKTGISSLIGQSEGSVFFDFTVDTISAQTNDPVLWYMKDGGAGERYIELYSNGNLKYVEYTTLPIASIIKTGLTVGRHKCAIAYATDDFVFYVDGIQVGTDTSGTPNGFSTFGLQYYSSSYFGQQKVNQAAIFKTRLSNTELASLTTL